MSRYINLDRKDILCTTQTLPLYRSTCVTWHPQLRTKLEMWANAQRDGRPA